MAEKLEQENPDIQDNSDELYERFNFKIDNGQEPLRIDKFLANRIERATRNKLQQAINAGMVLVNGKAIRPNYKVKPLDEIVIYSDMSPEDTDVVPEEMPLNIVYEDSDLMLVNKPAGMVVHPGSGNYSGTLLNGVAWYQQQTNPAVTEETLPRFGLVHRIDKNTSGLLVLAKTDIAMRQLAKQFFDHTISRKYIALVWGDLKEDEGTIVAHVGRHQRFRKLFEAYPEGDHGKDATTHYKGIEFFKTNRGGDITFHGPGQVVGYPIIDLEKYYTDIGKYLRNIEEVIILTLADYGIVAGRSPGETGVWLDAEIKGKERKICAIGVRTSRWITMHGFALNVNTDLNYFNFIVPCGISDKQVTSLQKELGREVDMEEVKERIKNNFEKIFDASFVDSN